MGGPAKKTAAKQKPAASTPPATGTKPQGPANSVAVDEMEGAVRQPAQTPTLDLLELVDEGVDGLRNLIYGAEHLLNPSFGIESSAPASQERQTATSTNFFTGRKTEREVRPEHHQQYTANGIPLTDDAWGLQNQVDGGKLQAVHDRALLGHMVSAGSVDASKLGDLSTMPADEVARHVAAARGEQSAEAYYGSMDPEVADTLQESMLSTYIDQANDSENASFILEMLPTDTTNLSGELLPTAIRDPETRLPNEFRVGEEVGQMRHSSVAVANQLRGDDAREDVFGLVVPYSNTASNVFARDGVPTDGSYNLHKTLRHIDQDVNTVATGYSQGGAAVLDYVHRYGDVDGLDAAVALAPMGGSDRSNLGADGLYHGMLNDVPTLSATHARDPARNVFENSTLETEQERDSDLFGRGVVFSRSGDGPLHSGFDPANPAAGTFGYPTQHLTPLIDGLLGGEMSNEAYSRRGDWAHDSRQK